MLFDGEVFRWQRLDNLVASAAQGSQLDLEGLLDQVISFLFSDNGGLLRNQLVQAAVDRIDSLAWQTTLRLSRSLPTPLQAFQPVGLREQAQLVDTAFDELVLDLEPIRQLVRILSALPGFEPRLLLSRLPRVVRDPQFRRMGLDLAQGLAERSLVRLLRDVLVRTDPDRAALQPA
jgi:hypothetical protein